MRVGQRPNLGLGSKDRKQCRMEWKELGEMLENGRALKRNSKELEGILIGPSMAPRISSPSGIPAMDRLAFKFSRLRF